MPVLLGVAAAAVSLAAGAGVALRADRRVLARLRDLSPAADPAGTPRRVVGPIVRALAASRLVRDERLDRRLVLAGTDGRVEDHAVRKVGWGLGGILAGLWLGGWGPSGLALGAILGAAAFRLPDVRLARLAARRQAEIARDAPDLFDLVCAGLATGLGPSACLGLAASELDGPLGDELRRACGAVAVGERWADALDDLVRRAEPDAIRRFRTALVQTDRLGASLESVLRDLARDARVERRAGAEARARAAPVKLLFPLVFVILPAFLLLTVVPVVLATLRNL